MNDRVGQLQGRAVAQSLRWEQAAWRATVEATCRFEDGHPLQVRPAGDDQWEVDATMLPEPLRRHGVVATAELIDQEPSAVITERSSDEQWFVPADLRVELRAVPAGNGAHQVVVVGTVELDPGTAAGGSMIPNGQWDPSLRFSVLGLQMRPRLQAAEAMVLPSPAIVGPRPVVAAPYLAGERGWLSLDVGQRKTGLLAAMIDRGLGPAELTREMFTIAAQVEIATDAARKPLRLTLLLDDGTVAGRLDAAVVASGSGAALRGDTTVDLRGKGEPDAIEAGRYTLAARSRAKDELTVLGTAAVDATGRVYEIDLTAVSELPQVR
jgi:hypothetical protein